MKKQQRWFLFGGLLLASVAAPPSGVLRADIQAPPGADHSPTRKLGRGISNLLYGFTEVPVTLAHTNEYEGGAAAWSLGVVKGVGRGFARTGVGFWEVLTWPFPTEKGKYTPTLRRETPWILNGYQEFPPELGWESRYRYVRTTGSN